jgi:hypothetical protein
MTAAQCHSELQLHNLIVDIDNAVSMSVGHQPEMPSDVPVGLTHNEINATPWSTSEEAQARYRQLAHSTLHLMQHASVGPKQDPFNDHIDSFRTQLSRIHDSDNDPSRRSGDETPKMIGGHPRARSLHGVARSALAMHVACIIAEQLDVNHLSDAGATQDTKEEISNTETREHSIDAIVTEARRTLRSFRELQTEHRPLSWLYAYAVFNAAAVLSMWMFSGKYESLDVELVKIAMAYFEIERGHDVRLPTTAYEQLSMMWTDLERLRGMKEPSTKPGTVKSRGRSDQASRKESARLKRRQGDSSTERPSIKRSRSSPHDAGLKSSVEAGTYGIGYTEASSVHPIYHTDGAQCWSELHDGNTAGMIFDSSVQVGASSMGSQAFEMMAGHPARERRGTYEIYNPFYPEFHPPMEYPAPPLRVSHDPWHPVHSMSMSASSEPMYTSGLDFHEVAAGHMQYSGNPVAAHDQSGALSSQPADIWMTSNAGMQQFEGNHALARRNSEATFAIEHWQNHSMAGGEYQTMQQEYAEVDPHLYRRSSYAGPPSRGHANGNGNGNEHIVMTTGGWRSPEYHFDDGHWPSDGQGQLWTTPVS